MKKTPARPARLRAPKVTARAATFTIDLSAYGLEAALGAAYLLTDRAYVTLGGDRTKALQVTLKPKSGSGETPKTLAAAYPRELESQKLRWEISKLNRPIREFVVEQAVLLASGQLPPEPSGGGAEAPSEELSAEQRGEIERLIAEVEAEIKALNDKKAPADPKKISASWEQKQEQAKIRAPEAP